jgi:hypothetical protein
MACRHSAVKAVIYCPVHLQGCGGGGRCSHRPACERQLASLDNSPKRDAGQLCALCVAATQVGSSHVPNVEQHVTGAL